MSLLIDHFGWRGNTEIPLDERRFAAMALLGIAWCFSRSRSPVHVAVRSGRNTANARRVPKRVDGVTDSL
ncbi:hypothetical protein KDX27_39225 [Burkholderia cenocepacia]|uniref:hypothetical protein n=1 Tax=Burkholderia cepacia complex TaxID=87882 RepID=UPI001B9DA932|nr:hypothetical protein [Burkholderia cenocepacia]MCO8320379.1 hypothetical protein [Burkholderia multivorans]